MEPEASQLIVDSLNVNFIDVEQYPSSAEIERRCVAMLAELYHAPLAPGVRATGTATIGSSEAILLAGLALKTRWQERRRAAGLPADKPNIVFGHNTQVCWEKFTRCAHVSIDGARMMHTTPHARVAMPASMRALIVCALPMSRHHRHGAVTLTLSRALWTSLTIASRSRPSARCR